MYPAATWDRPTPQTTWTGCARLTSYTQDEVYQVWDRAQQIKAEFESVIKALDAKYFTGMDAFDKIAAEGAAGEVYALLVDLNEALPGFECCNRRAATREPYPVKTWRAGIAKYERAIKKLRAYL